MTKKAITQKLTGSDVRWDEDASLQAADITISIDHDLVSVQLNTTGESLHER
jgi:23S rRNA G2445 N2-methylase RlmL